MIEIIVGGLATVLVAIGGWVLGISGRVAKVETYQGAQKERLDSFESQILRRLDRIDEKLDAMAGNSQNQNQYGQYGR